MTCAAVEYQSKEGHVVILSFNDLIAVQEVETTPEYVALGFWFKTGHYLSTHVDHDTARKVQDTYRRYLGLSR